jgi:hypothetical protein
MRLPDIAFPSRKKSQRQTKSGKMPAVYRFQIAINRFLLIILTQAFRVTSLGNVGKRKRTVYSGL